DATGPTPASALVVEPSLAEALSIVSTLLRLGFRTTIAHDFYEAKARLLMRPALLVTELRLGAYKGMPLVLAGKSTHPAMAALIMSGTADPVLSAEAERLGATFVLKAVSGDDLAAAVCRTVFRIADYPAEPVRPPFERRKGTRRITLTDRA